MASIQYIQTEVDEVQCHWQLPCKTSSNLRPGGHTRPVRLFNTTRKIWNYINAVDQWSMIIAFSAKMMVKNCEPLASWVSSVLASSS